MIIATKKGIVSEIMDAIPLRFNFIGYVIIAFMIDIAPNERQNSWRGKRVAEAT